MNRKLHRATRDWLRSESSGQSTEAEEALRRVFSRLPSESVPFGFAEQVLERAGLTSVADRRRSLAGLWGLRAALSLCLLSVALFVLVLPGYVPALLGIFNPERLTEVGVGAVMSVFHQLGSGLVVWRALSAAGSIVTSTLSSPQGLAALLAALLLSIGGLRALHQVIFTERSSRYVRSA